MMGRYFRKVGNMMGRRRVVLLKEVIVLSILSFGFRFLNIRI